MEESFQADLGAEMAWPVRDWRVGGEFRERLPRLHCISYFVFRILVLQADFCTCGVGAADRRYLTPGHSGQLTLRVDNAAS